MSEQNMQGTGMNQNIPQGSMQMGSGQVPQGDPYAAYQQWDQGGAYPQAQPQGDPYAAYRPWDQAGGYPQGQPQYDPYTAYPQGNPTGSYQIPQQAAPNQQPAQTFQGQYVDYGTSGNYPQSSYHSGPIKVPQLSMATGEQVLYNAPMAPADGATGPIPVPQMSREGLSESPKIHVGQGSGKKKALITCAVLAVLACAAFLVYTFFFAGRSPYTAQDVVAALYRKGLPIESPLVYTESTDPDGLLGTMNQYTSKVSWTDRRAKSGTETFSLGGIIEVFPNADLAQERLRQLNLMLPSQAGAVSQVNRAVMRLSTGLTSSQITEYQDALKAIFGK